MVLQEQARQEQEQRDAELAATLAARGTLTEAVTPNAFFPVPAMAPPTPEAGAKVGDHFMVMLVF